MNDPAKPWNGDQVRRWLERRFAASKLDQAAADRRGYAAQGDYDDAAAEEWVCRALRAADCTDDQTALATRLKDLLREDGYQVTGIYDDARFERCVRGHLRKLARMTRANDGFEKTLRYQ